MRNRAKRCSRARSLMMPTNRSTPLLLPVSPAEPTIIGTPSRRAASSMCSRSCLCHCSGLDETSAPSGPGPTSHDPESAQIRSGAQSSPIRKLPVLIGANPRCPLGHRMRSEDPDDGTCPNPKIDANSPNFAHYTAVAPSSHHSGNYAFRVFGTASAAGDPLF